ncbi:AAA family ATPase [Pseudalkalibacillus decolorationis]|uniref:AAA family ATPase n=1 Tax=Pseudalkalibacillus decolorationis TaxID=163879 RepID=UPI0021491F2C|nr:AAA family ATPase [Pseudalkalibacillus decolorationis]
MRPIHLSVSGLHSFRDKENVDFQSLCDGGVFGIFGPTGSGKSSLLDAVTLALYGKVERATNNIQGIMNHAEKQLHVAFTFELGDRLNGKRYRVERAYRRTKDESVRTSSCRLIEVDREDSIVLADKERDVTGQVEKVLGLTLTDFTRAVVLPQGKFAEFLSLKGADRRQMLQRLFHLEQYGDKLNNRLKLRLDETRTELKEIVAEQQGLGNASQEALQETELQLKKAIEDVSQKDHSLKSATEQFERYRQIWAWQEELLKVEQKLRESEGKLPHIQDIRERLTNARQADSLLPYVEELEGATKEKNYWTERKDLLHKSLAKSQIHVEKAEQELTKCSEKRSAEEPMLYKKLQEYKHAKDLEKELKEKRRRYQTQKESFKSNDEQLVQLQKSLETLREKKQKATERQGHIKGELEQKTVSYKDRNHLREALSLKKDIVVLQQTRDELIGEKNTNQETQQMIITQERSVLTKNSQYIHRIHGLLGQTEGIYNRICEHERVIEQAKDRIATSIKNATTQQNEADVHDLAIQLANQLKEEQACPVCGSIEHPHLATSEMMKVDYNKQRTDLEEMLKAIRDEETVIGDSKRDLQHMFVTLKDYTDSRKGDKDEIAATLYDPMKDSVDSINELHEYLRLLKTETKGFRQDVIELKEKRDECVVSLRSCDKQCLEFSSKLTTLKDDFRKMEKKYNDCEQQLQVKTSNWESQFNTFPFATLENKQKEMDRIDEEAASLKKRFETSVNYITTVEEELNKVSEHYQTLQLNVTKLSSNVSELHSRCEEITNKIDTLCDGNSADELIGKVETELSELKVSESKVKDELNTENEQLQRFEKELEAAKQSTEQARAREELANLRWEEKCAQSAMTSQAEVKDSIVRNEIQKQWEEELDTFTSRYQNLKHDQRRLTSHLDENTISEKQWNVAREDLEKAKSDKDTALSTQARLEETVEQLRTRTKKFEALENRRVVTEELSERLGKLQAVFRGNSFVEFVAEEQLVQVARDASERLGELTKHRYAIEVDSSGGFIIRDDANGGIRRPVSSLSGGETFLTSLALALSLSAQIQLQGQHPLEFFFLDEGFGTLDQELLETVITALERLQLQQLSVGVISHVPELRARLPKKLIVEPAQPSGNGSSVYIETL